MLESIKCQCPCITINTITNVAIVGDSECLLIASLLRYIMPVCYLLVNNVKAVAIKCIKNFRGTVKFSLRGKHTIVLKFGRWPLLMVIFCKILNNTAQSARLMVVLLVVMCLVRVTKASPNTVRWSHTAGQCYKLGYKKYSPFLPASVITPGHVHHTPCIHNFAASAATITLMEPRGEQEKHG